MAGSNGFIWFWKNDQGSWTPYPDAHQDAIETARIRGDDHAILGIGPNQTPYLLNFRDEVQENLELRNRRRLVSKANEHTVWYWRDDDGVTWNVYDRDHAELLTRAEAAHEDEVYLVIHQTLYRIDLPRRLQINYDNLTTREIRQGRRPIQRQWPLPQISYSNSSNTNTNNQDPLPDIPIDPDMEKAAPASFICPITLHIMHDPVTTSAGSTYDRKAIQWWLNGHDTDPLTKRPIREKLLVPNNALQETIEDWKQTYRRQQQNINLHSPTQTKPPNTTAQATAGEFGNHSLKMVFLGHHRMGTTSILQKLVHGNGASSPTTSGDSWNPPGLHINDWRPTSDLQVSVWDWQGSDSLHSFRSMGFTPQAIYVIVWDMGDSLHDNHNQNHNNTHRTTENTDNNDKALKRDIRDKVQYWVDRILEKVPNALLLPVASFADKFGVAPARSQAEAQRRVRLLRDTLVVPPPATILWCDDDHDPVLRVSGYSSAGMDRLRERLVGKILSQQQLTTTTTRLVGGPVPHHYEIRQTIRSLKQQGCKMIKVDILERDLERVFGIPNDSLAEALSFLSNIGEVLNFPALPDPFNKIIILDQSWFFRLCGCILRPNLRVAVRDARRLIGKGNAFSFGDAVSEYCPVLWKDDALMLWRNHLATTDFGQSLAAEHFPLSVVLDYVLTLMIHMGVLVPLDDLDIGPLSSSAMYSHTYAASKPRIVPPSRAQRQDDASCLSADLLCIPTLLNKGDHENGLSDISFVSGSSPRLARQVAFQGHVPGCLMEKVTVALLRNITRRLRENNTATTNRGELALERIHCWRSVFRIRWSWNTLNDRGEEQETTVEVTSQLVDATFLQNNDGMNSTDGAVAYLLTNATVIKGGGGQNVFEAGFGLVVETLQAVLEGLQLTERVFCPDCLASKGVHGSYSWGLNEVEETQNGSGKPLKCGGGHLVSSDFLTGVGSGAEMKSTNDIQRVWKQAVVLLGLYDARERTNKIKRLGSGVIVDASRGLIVTAARNLMRIEGEAQFGQNYCGILGGKVVVGVMPSEGSDEAVFRYYARIVTKDPALSKNKICRVDACVLKITSRFECDVTGNGDGCCEEIEILLRDNPAKIAAQRLVQLPTQMNSNLEDRVYIFGFEEKPGLGVNRQISSVSGYICQKISATESSADRYTYKPLNTTVIMASARQGYPGGPCVNKQGEIIGILSSGDPNEDSRSFVVPTSDWELLVRAATLQVVAGMSLQGQLDFRRAVYHTTSSSDTEEEQANVDAADDYRYEYEEEAVEEENEEEEGEEEEDDDDDDDGRPKSGKNPEHDGISLADEAKDEMSDENDKQESTGTCREGSQEEEALNNRPHSNSDEHSYEATEEQVGSSPNEGKVDEMSKNEIDKQEGTNVHRTSTMNGRQAYKDFRLRTIF